MAIEMLPFVDISKYQGKYNMASDPGPMIMMKASGGDDGLYLDSELDNNYADALAAGKIPFMYHVAGNGDPATEANFYFDAVSPLAIGDGYALDLEPTCNWTVAQILTFVTNFHSKTNTYPWIYMDISRCNAYDWAPVLDLCGLWIAAPSYPWAENVPIKYTYIAQQGPIVNGVDSDMFFGNQAQLEAYTYKTNTPPTTTTTTFTTTTTHTTSTSSSTSTTVPTTTSTTTKSTTSTTTTLPPPAPTPVLSRWQRFWKWLMTL